MNVYLENIQKKFAKERVIRNCSLQLLQSQESYALTGANGSGKSTLLQIIAGFLPPSQGSLRYEHEGKNVDISQIFRYLSFSAPYLELAEEFTLKELLRFHTRFKALQRGLSFQEFMEKTRLDTAADKYIKHFSSGMKQRLKLGLCFYTQTPLVLLDEPTSNLDKTGIDWYQKEVICNLEGRLFVIASNQEYEYEFCENVFPVQQP